MYVVFQENKKNCIFSRKPIHEGAIFRVEGNYDMVSYSSECTFIPEGNFPVFETGFSLSTTLLKSNP